MKKLKRFTKSWLVRRLLQEGRRLSSEGRFYEARKVYAKLLSIDESHAEAKAYVSHFDELELWIEPKRGQGGTEPGSGE